MKKNVFPIAFILLASIGGFAQATDKTVDTIKKLYVQVSDRAAECEADDDKGAYGPLFMNTLSINSRNHQWRAVGTYNKTYKFFYTDGDSETSMYPDKLILVKLDRRVSNRTYHEEFLFSENGTLAYYAQRAENDNESPASREMYFAKNIAIRIVEDAKVRNKLLPKDLNNAKATVADVIAIKAIFQQSIK